jgi:Family of unknown function (DUF5681)
MNSSEFSLPASSTLPARPVNTGQKQVNGRAKGYFRLGRSGNPRGRPKGARNKLGEAFLDALQADFEEHGASVIAEVREKLPHQYLKIIASILPKELGLDDTPAIPPVARIILQTSGPPMAQTNTQKRRAPRTP